MFIPKYSITNLILTNIAKIETAKEIIESAPLVPTWEAKFREEAMLRTVHHGTHIEGNLLNFAEAKEVLAGRHVIARDRDIQEVINYRNVIKYIDGIQNGITEETILNIHRRATDKVLQPQYVGKYREVQVAVKNSKTGEVSFMPPPVALVPRQLNEFLTWLASDEGKMTHPILKAGIIHYELARIHPFVDGNGRTARAAATLSLFLDRYDIKKFFSLEEFFDRDSLRYYQALQAVSNQQVTSESSRDLTPWLEYFTEGLVQELTQVKERVQKLSADLKLKKRVGQIALSVRQAKLMEYMQDYGRIANNEWRSLIPDVSDDTVLRDLKVLLRKKLIRSPPNRSAWTNADESTP